jgi:hypothetical protein
MLGPKLTAPGAAVYVRMAKPGVVGVAAAIGTVGLKGRLGGPVRHQPPPPTHVANNNPSVP